MQVNGARSVRDNCEGAEVVEREVACSHLTGGVTCNSDRLHGT